MNIHFKLKRHAVIILLIFFPLFTQATELPHNLYDAAISGNLGRLQKILDNRKDLDINYISKDGWSLLAIAVSYNREEIVKELINRKADVNVRSLEEGWPVLFVAINNNLLNMVKILLEAKANTEKTDYSGATPLMFAAQQDNVQAADILIRAGANINAQDLTGKTALMLSIEKSPNVFKYLVNAGADLSLRDLDNSNAASIAFIWNKKEYIELLAQKGFGNINSNMLNYGARRAARDGDISKLMYLIQLGYNVKDSGENISPLIDAVIYRQNDMVLKLLQLGADPNVNDKGMLDQWEIHDSDQYKDSFIYIEPCYGTPLHFAATIKDETIFVNLLKHGAGINIQDRYGNTPLMLTYEYFTNNISFINIGLKYKADLNMTGRYGKTLLMLAAAKGDLPAVRKLASAGADINALDNDGNDAAAYANRAKHMNVFRFLKKLQEKHEK